MTTRSATPRDTASRVWIALHEFVTGQDRRRALRAALDLGPGKVEVLIRLADGPMTLREIARARRSRPTSRDRRRRPARSARPGPSHRPPRRQPPQARALHRPRTRAAQRGQAILDAPPPALTNLDSDDLARLGEILTRLQTNKRPL